MPGCRAENGNWRITAKARGIISSSSKLGNHRLRNRASATDRSPAPAWGVLIDFKTSERFRTRSESANRDREFRYGFHWLRNGLEELHSSRQTIPPPVITAPPRTKGFFGKVPFPGTGVPPFRFFLLQFPDWSGV